MRAFDFVLNKNQLSKNVFVFVLLFIVSFSWATLADESTSEHNFILDTDQDGLTNEEEKAFGTDPENPDTDGDGYSDGVEIESGYDPKRPAPGDRLIPDAVSVGEGGQVAGDNVTLQASAALAEIVQDVTTNTENPGEISMTDVDAALEKALAPPEEIVLPEIDIDSIKVKKVSSKLKGDEKKEAERKDVIEYLTLMGYIMMNNSPIAVKEESEVTSVIRLMSEQSFGAILSGDSDYLDTLERQGNKFLDEIKDVEVPENMLDLHVKAIKLGQYASGLKSKMGNSGDDDPLRQMEGFGELQALFGEVQSFMFELEGKVGEYGINDISVEL